MIRALVDFALKSRWLVLGAVVVLSAWGIISFRALPVEAYPDVANNYVQIITQWPGRSAEEIERQVTVPVENQMAGIPHLVHIALEDAGWPLQPDAHFRRRLHQRRQSRARYGATRPSQSACRSQPADGHRLEPGRPDLLVHAGKHQPRLRRDGEEVPRRLDAGKIFQACQWRGGCLQLRRTDQGVPDQARPGEAGFLWIKHRPGRTANLQ